MKTRGSLQRWLTVAALLAVAVSVGIAGIFAGRTLQRRIVSEAEASLESVLRLGAHRMSDEARQLKGSGRKYFGGRDLGAMGEFSWLVEGVRGGPRSSPSEGFEELARTETFPFDDVAALSDLSIPAESSVHFTIRENAGGEPYRIAVLAFTPALDRPPGFPDDRSPRRGPGGGPEGDRRPPRGDDRGPPATGPNADRGGRGRPMAGPRFGPNERFQVYLAKSIGEEEAILGSLYRTLLLAGAVAVGLSAIIVPWTVRRGLRPVRDISKKISDVDESRLDRALEIDALPAELAPIVQSFEGVREHLSAAFAREGRFTSNAAHELRTPLAGLRASLEVALRRERSSDQYRSTIDECLGITCSMQSMVDSLLLLAKGTGSEQSVVPVDVEAAIRRAFAERADDLVARNITVEWDAVAAPTVPCIEVLAERIFANTVANVVQYAASGSEVEVGFEESATRLDIRIANSADSLATDTAARAFEPLWRGDSARTDVTLHAGLGLSIVLQCVEALGGSVSVRAEDGRFELSLSLPR